MILTQMLWQNIVIFQTDILDLVFSEIWICHDVKSDVQLLSLFSIIICFFIINIPVVAYLICCLLEINFFRFYNIIGVIPDEIGRLKNLLQLSMSSNKLTGPLLPPFFNMSSVQYVCLTHNSLNGTLPKEIGNMQALTQLYIDHNALTGQILATCISSTTISI